MQVSSTSWHRDQRFSLGTLTNTQGWAVFSLRNREVLQGFVATFPFGGVRLDVALRLFLEAFRLPGESAEIETILQAFSG